MADLSPRNLIPLPREFEEPFFDTARNRDLAWDAGVYANAENSQLQFTGGGNMGWDADANGPAKGILFWSRNIEVTGWSMPYQAVFSGPASVELQDGEVLFFLMPRLMSADTIIPLYRSNRIFLEGTRLHDLRLFCAREGTTLYFYNGKSLADEDEGVLFGAGLAVSSPVAPHSHSAALVFNPGAGVFDFDMGITSPLLERVDAYRNGVLQTLTDDYSVNLTTGIVTITPPTISAFERLTFMRQTRDLASPTTTHDHLAPLVIKPLPAQTLLDMLATAPTLAAVDLFRGGVLQTEPDDYTLDLGTGFVTLVLPTITGETFQALRRINL